MRERRTRRCHRGRINVISKREVMVRWHAGSSETNERTLTCGKHPCSDWGITGVIGVIEVAAPYAPAMLTYAAAIVGAGEVYQGR